jgi:hypothetical protein
MRWENDEEIVSNDCTIHIEISNKDLTIGSTINNYLFVTGYN